MQIHKENRVSRLLAFVLAACLLLTGVASAAETTQKNVCGEGLTWSLDDTGSVLTISGQGPMTNYGDEAANAAPWGRGIKEVIIRYGVTSIGVEAFYGCTQLTRVVIPSSITSIGYAAFAGCEKLSRVVLPGSVANVYASAFAGCTNLSEVRLSQSMTQIWAGTFQGCGLTSVTIPANITRISSSAFADCAALKKVRFLGSVPKIASDAFEGVTTVGTFSESDTLWWTEGMRDYGGTFSWNVENLKMPFVDVQASHWSYPAITYAYQENLIQGTDATHFSPNAAATRAQVVMALWRLEGEPQSNYAVNFRDVASTAPYAQAVRWAVEKGIAAGYTKTTFSPNATVTREQLAVMIYNFEQKLHSNSGFVGPWTVPQHIQDMNRVSAGAVEAVRSMLYREILRGNNYGFLNPTNTCSRAELATILLRCGHQQGA